MKKQEVSNLRNKNSAELKKELQERQELLRSAKFDLASGKVKNIYLVKETKRTIARIKTFLNLNKDNK